MPCLTQINNYIYIEEESELEIFIEQCSTIHTLQRSAPAAMNKQGTYVLLGRSNQTYGFELLRRWFQVTRPCREWNYIAGDKIIAACAGMMKA
jgi:hypothetical protein